MAVRATIQQREMNQRVSDSREIVYPDVDGGASRAYPGVDTVHKQKIPARRL